MCMRDPDLLQRDAELFAGIFEQGHITTRVDDGAFHRLVTPDDRAVLLERGNGNGFVLKHPEMVA